MAVKMTEAQRKAIDKGARIIETQGYDAFMAFLSRNLAKANR